MFSAYIKNFKRNGAIITNEEQMFTIPSANGFPIQRPMVKCSEDSADNFSFTMDMNSPYYDALLQLKTIIRVEYDGDVIFNGRVLSIATSTVFHTKNVTCEGFYAYTNDTYYEGKQEKFREKIYVTHNADDPTVSNYLDKIIANHNASIGSDKQFAKGTVDPKLEIPKKKDKYEPTSWSQTSNLLSGLTGDFGGHMRIRFQNGAPKLDWYKYYAHDAGDNNRPKVEVLKNVLDLSSDDEVDIIFTRVIPIGDTNSDGETIYIDGYKYTDYSGNEHTHSGKSISVTKICELYDDDHLKDEFHNASDYHNAETNYGIIYKTIQFGNADTKEKLWNETKKWIKNCFFGLASSFTVKALDLHIIDPNGGDPKILLGECVDVTYYIKKDGSNSPVWETKKLVCKSVQFDLFNPENNNYTFGIPTDMLENNKNNSSNKRAASEQTPPKKTPPKQGDGTVITWRGVWHMIGVLDSDPEYEGTQAADSFYRNGELTGTATCYDPNEVIDNDGNTIGDHPENYPDCWFKAKVVGKIAKVQTQREDLPAAKQVAVSEERGVFAFVHGRYPNPVTHWYSQRKGYHYQYGDSGMSSEDRIYILIKEDAHKNYGGEARANSFKAMGRLKGDVTIYDGEQTPAVKFTGEIVGKFKTDADQETVYIGISKEYGVFAYDYSAYPIYVKHWYTRAKGLTYDNIGGFIATENPPQVFTTDDGTPEGTTTVLIDGEDKAYPKYSKDKTYNNGDFVAYNGRIFICNTNIIIPEEFNPSHWTPYALEPQPKYSNKKTYRINDRVEYNGYLYRCIVAINTPEEFAQSHWEYYGATNLQGSTGKIFAGKDLTGEGDNWRIKLNEPVLYNDESGTQRIADGFVSASDFHIQSVPSFKTKLAVVDVLIAGKVNAVDIEADLAYIRKINSDSISANTIISSSQGNFTRVAVGGTSMGSTVPPPAGVYSNNIYYSESGMSPINVMNHIYAAYQMSETSGTVKLQGKRMTNQSGAWVDLASFNMAATTFYRDAVAAAWNDGGKSSCFGLTKSSTLNPGDSTTIQAYYTNHNGVETTSTHSSTSPNRYSSFTVSARSLRLRTPQAAVTPGTSNQTITPGSDSGGTLYDGLAQVVVEGDSDLVVENIRNGKTIFGKTGTYRGYLRTPQSAVTPGTSNQTITPGSDSGGTPYDGLTQVVVKGDADLIPENIRKDIQIFGVTGSYEGEGGEINLEWLTEKSYATEFTDPTATDDQGQPHACTRIKNLGTITSAHKSIRVIFKINGVQYYYYFAINR